MRGAGRARGSTLESLCYGAPMLNEARARPLAEATLNHPGLSLGAPRELHDGWFFPYRSDQPLAGSNGIIVNKNTGRVFHLGSAFPVERDLALYDLGYQFDRYDLVILQVNKMKETISALVRLGLQVVEITYEHGQVWRIPRSMKTADLQTRLEKLPCVFPAQGLYFKLEVLEEARLEGWFTFEALEYRSPK
jgi:hypothetical protein